MTAPTSASRASGASAPRPPSTSRTHRRAAGRGAGLGSGILDIPDAPTFDPREAVLTDPVLPEDRRRCSWCGERVGASRFGRPGRTKGFCVHCGTRFNLDPQLLPGTLLADQYEVVGCLAYGGQGWVYLAVDRHVRDRWVAIKGLLNLEDSGGLETVRAELGFLALVAHPAIVKVYNFVSHGDTNYLVMEYIGGRSLKQSIGNRGPGETASHARDLTTSPRVLMPVDQALAYIIEVLGALQYLHDLQLIYCDLKPDNIIHSGSYVRLIDLGAVRAADDITSPIFGTHGFQAPEIPDQSVPTIESDIYTVGRTLLLLTCDLPDFTTTSGMPTPEASVVLGRYDSFYWLLARACDPLPAERFGSAEEMRAQALGVLREVVAADSSRGRAAPHVQTGENPVGADSAGLGAAEGSAVSTHFTAPLPATPDGSWLELPIPLLDRDDPGAALISEVASEDPHVRLARLAEGPADSLDVLLEGVRTSIDLGELDGATELLDRAEAMTGYGTAPLPPRLLWWKGVVAAAKDEVEEANRQFQEVYWQLPGELAPKLALGLARELADEPGEAEEFYRICLRTDTAYVPAAAFGLARLRRAAGDSTGARDALTLVPASSSAHLLARQQVARLWLGSAAELAEVTLALDIADTAGFSAFERAIVQVRGMRRGLDLVLAGGAHEGVQVDGQPATEAGLRLGLERALRDLAKLTDDRASRYALVDEANRVRPWTLT